AEAGYRELVRGRPLSFYGLLAAARLGGQKAELPDNKSVPDEAPAKAAKDPKDPKDPIVARALELLDAGMTVEAGIELQRAEKDILKRAGGDKAVPWLLSLYRRTESFHRAYQLAESRGGAALAAAPTG